MTETEDLEKIFRALRCKVDTQPDGTLVVSGELNCTVKKRVDGLFLLNGDLNLKHLGLIELPDFSKLVVTGFFSCYGNELESLKGSPAFTGGDFHCGKNALKSVKHASQSVGGTFNCRQNPLASLEDAPAAFGALESDFGAFASWAAIPLHLAPETKTRQIENIISGATVLKNDMPRSRPIQIRKAVC